MGILDRKVTLKEAIDFIIRLVTIGIILYVVLSVVIIELKIEEKLSEEETISKIDTMLFFNSLLIFIIVGFNYMGNIASNTPSKKDVKKIIEEAIFTRNSLSKKDVKRIIEEALKRSKK